MNQTKGDKQRFSPSLIGLSTRAEIARIFFCYRKILNSKISSLSNLKTKIINYNQSTHITYFNYKQNTKSNIISLQSEIDSQYSYNISRNLDSGKYRIEFNKEMKRVDFVCRVKNRENYFEFQHFSMIAAATTK